MGYIPLSEILAFCELAGVQDGDDRVEFLEIIQGMDKAFVEFHTKEADRRVGGVKRNNRP